MRLLTAVAVALLPAYAFRLWWLLTTDGSGRVVNGVLTPSDATELGTVPGDVPTDGWDQRQVAMDVGTDGRPAVAVGGPEGVRMFGDPSAEQAERLNNAFPTEASAERPAAGSTASSPITMGSRSCFGRALPSRRPGPYCRRARTAPVTG